MSKKLVYYLDDEESLCEVVSEFLSGIGYEVVTFTQSMAAIDSCKQRPPALIFIDYRLADGTGDKVAMALHKTIPKVLVTGELKPPEQELFVTTLLKPFGLQDLASTIEEQLKLS